MWVVFVGPNRSQHGFLLDEGSAYIRPRSAFCAQSHATRNVMNDQDRVDGRSQRHQDEAGRFPEVRQAHDSVIGQLAEILPCSLTRYHRQC
jgi:hypothetical protein